MSGDEILFFLLDNTDFTANPTLGYFTDTTPNRVQFTVIEDTGVTSWRWNFGDGTSIFITDPTQKNVAHDYTSEGVYTVSLMFNENTNLTITKFGYIICLRTLGLSIITTPQYFYGALPGSGVTFQFGVTNQTRELDNTVAGGYNGFQWNFGDSSSQNGVTGPYHTYTSYGTYNGTLTIRDIGVSGLDYTKQTTLFSTSVSLFNLLIQATPNLGLLPLPVSFTVTTAPGSYEPVTWRWIFRDSSESNTKNTSHTFTTADTYDVVLITDEGLSSQQIFCSDPAYPGVNVVVPDLQIIASGLSADFEVTPSHGYLPFTGLYDGSLTQGFVTGWNWDFDDGTSHVYGETAPYHFYSSADTYNPILTVYDIYGLSSVKTKTVEVLSDLDITIHLSTTYAPAVVTFTPVHDTYTEIWNWELIYTDSVLGDLVVAKKNATSSIDKIFITTINAPASYRIRLTATDDYSTVVIAEKSFSVPENISIVTYPSPAIGMKPLLVDFSTYGAVYSTVSAWQWDFTGDGVYEETTETASYTYEDDGEYTAFLHLTWQLQDVNIPGKSAAFSIDKIAVINVIPYVLSISIQATPSIGQKELTVQFVGVANNPVASWSWELEGVGSIGITQNTSYTFTEIGNYVVTLSVTDTAGNPFSTNQVITVLSGTSTQDLGPGDNVFLSLKGSGKSVFFNEKGVSLKIPVYEINPTPLGFARSGGPTIIFD